MRDGPLEHRLLTGATVSRTVCELRRSREALGLSQAEFAARLGVSADSYRAWDSGRRAAPAAIVHKAQSLVQVGDDVALPLGPLATEFGIHVRTLRAAARDGRLAATFEARSYFGHAVAWATRRAVRTFVVASLGKSAKALGCRPALITAPPDYASRVIGIRRRLGISQAALARRVGAAHKAVVYQWECGKRKPSPVFWAKLMRLRLRCGVPSRKPHAV